MKQTITKLGGALLSMLFLMPSSALAEWRDIKVNLTNGNLLETGENVQWRWVNGNESSGDYIGIAVDTEGNVSRVAKDDVNARCQIKGKWHSNQWGWNSLEVKIPVEAGIYKITYGDAYNQGGDVTLNDGTSSNVIFNTYVVGKLWSSSNPSYVVSNYYIADAEKTLTLTGGNYQPYFAIEKVDESKVNIAYSLGGETCEGVLPVNGVYEATPGYTIPANFLLYKEDYTLTGWTDGVNTYVAGDVITSGGLYILNPIFTPNTVSLDDRTSEVTVHWNFRTDQGVPSFSTSSGIIVGQADINGTPIDIKLDISGGTFATNQSAQWARVANVNFTIPVRKGSVFRTYQMNNTSLGTFDGVSGGTVTSNILSYNYTGDASSMVAGLNDANWYQYIEVTYPVIAVSPAKEFTTFCSTSPLDFSNVDGLEAYVVTGSTTTTITLAQVTKVPANTGLILKKTGSAASYNVPVGTATSLAETNKLVGVTEETTFTAGDYLLSNGKFVKGTAGTLAAGKAYLPATSVAGAREMLLDFGGTTGIHQIESAKQRVEGYYNLAGQRVAQPRKGLYIVNGKKVVIK